MSSDLMNFKSLMRFI